MSHGCSSRRYSTLFLGVALPTNKRDGWQAGYPPDSSADRELACNDNSAC